ncbi:DUF427 domain-containing protein [Gluconacetobacter tumulisoli]|uniref:DUF427 domain-containing protein n=1 Tax=Gluconacetobacter tumulisoli TaxID=1286189 RepID=A0A7W4K7K4_9PROT|nr:DUF427 domain-containing protein [Gluconacetobacter tumulisoli]MBB2201839.1 DUF427 domain-containing protein [Gluconacetobacter tumulisoli]
MRVVAPKVTLQPRMADAPRLVNVLATPKRVRAYLGARLVADSRAVLTLRSNHFLPIYFFPAGDVDPSLLKPSEAIVDLPELGRIDRVWDVVSDGEEATAAAWSGDFPPDTPWAALSGYIGLEFRAFSRWMEEGEEVFVHPRDPYARIEILDGDERIDVEAGGILAASSARPRLVIETHLPVRYYLPKADVRMDHLTPSALRTRCPYKGEASYWNLVTEKGTIENIAWSYETPIPEMSRIGGMICFYADRVDAIRRNGVNLSVFGI